MLLSEARPRPYRTSAAERFARDMHDEFRNEFSVEDEMRGNAKYTTYSLDNNLKYKDKRWYDDEDKKYFAAKLAGDRQRNSNFVRYEARDVILRMISDAYERKMKLYAYLNNLPVYFGLYSNANVEHNTLRSYFDIEAICMLYDNRDVSPFDKNVDDIRVYANANNNRTDITINSSYVSVVIYKNIKTNKIVAANVNIPRTPDTRFVVDTTVLNKFISRYSTAAGEVGENYDSDYDTDRTLQQLTLDNLKTDELFAVEIDNYADTLFKKSLPYLKKVNTKFISHMKSVMNPAINSKLMTVAEHDNLQSF